MKVVMFVSNPFTSDPRVYAEARSLVGAGHEVTVVARDAERKNVSRQNWDGIEVMRLRTRLAPRHGFASWLWNGLNLFLWQRQAYRQALALNREKRLDVIHCHDLDTLAIGTRLKGKLRLPLVYDAHEIYGYMMTRTFSRRMAGVFLWLERRLIRKADKIINVCEPQRTYFEGITDKPISVIMNCKPLQGLEYRPRTNEDFTLLYVGGLHQGRAVPMLLRTARELPGVRCLVGGIGQPSYVEALKEECAGTSNTTFLGRVPFDQVMPITKEVDCVFFMINPQDLNNRMGLGNKQFEAMVCGTPIICTKGTYSGELTEQEEVGLAVEYSDQALKEAIVKLRDDPELAETLGRNALKAAITKYNWQKEEEKLLELYRRLQIRSVVSRNKPRPDN
jgi:glycosyltransferase involved in cell wall biosynthesis